MISDFGIVILMCCRRRIFSPQLNRHLRHYICILLCVCMATASNAAIASVNGVMQNRNNVVEGSGMPLGGEPGSYSDEWKASGLNPDDEPGDVEEEGSGNDSETIDGSGIPSSSNKHRNDGSTTTNDENIRVNEALLNANIRQLQPSSTEASPSTTSRVIIHRPEVEVPSLAAPGSTSPPIQFHVASSSPASFITTKTSKTPSSSFAVATVKPTIRPPIPPQLPPYVTEDESYELLKPGILAAISGGGVVGVLVVILVVMFIVYRLRKKDEGSYSLDEPHQPPNYSYAYQKAATKEFYA